MRGDHRGEGHRDRDEHRGGDDRRMGDRH
jgi:hypothetical protein